MSSALVREALEFVDQDNNISKRSKRRSVPRRRPGDIGQVSKHPNKKKNKTAINIKPEDKDEVLERISKLLAQSAPIVDSTITAKIVERAVKGKPLLEKVEVKKDKDESILFPKESFKEFESHYFCS